MLPLLFLGLLCFGWGFGEGGREGERAGPHPDILFTIQWNTSEPKGYKVASLKDFASYEFEYYYNLNKGLVYNTNNPPTALYSCGLGVKEGYLMYPKSDEFNASPATFQNDNGNSSCFAIDTQGNHGMIATIENGFVPCGGYTSKVFAAPVQPHFFAKNFFTTSSDCELSQTDDRYTLFVKSDFP